MSMATGDNPSGLPTGPNNVFPEEPPPLETVNPNQVSVAQLAGNIPLSRVPETDVLASRASNAMSTEEASIAKRKNTSFKITNILPSRPPSNDPDESGEDDPDDSRTEDISDIIDDNVVIMSARRPLVPVVQRNSSLTGEISATMYPVSEFGILVNQSGASTPGQGPVHGPRDRFKVVKIETSSPQRRGRWMCIEYTDRQTSTAPPLPAAGQAITSTVADGTVSTNANVEQVSLPSTDHQKIILSPTVPTAAGIPQSLADEVEKVQYQPACKEPSIGVPPVPTTATYTAAPVPFTNHPASVQTSMSQAAPGSITAVTQPVMPSVPATSSVVDTVVTTATAMRQQRSVPANLQGFEMVQAGSGVPSPSTSHLPSNPHHTYSGPGTSHPPISQHSYITQQTLPQQSALQQQQQFQQQSQYQNLTQYQPVPVTQQSAQQQSLQQQQPPPPQQPQSQPAQQSTGTQQPASVPMMAGQTSSSIQSTVGVQPSSVVVMPPSSVPPVVVMSSMPSSASVVLPKVSVDNSGAIYMTPSSVSTSTSSVTRHVSVALPGPVQGQSYLAVTSPQVLPSNNPSAVSSVPPSRDPLGGSILPPSNLPPNTGARDSGYVAPAPLPFKDSQPIAGDLLVERLEEISTQRDLVEDAESASGTNQGAIDNRIEQAMDLVKSHLMNAVRSEVEELKEKIIKLEEIINQLQTENDFLKANVNRDVLLQLQQQQQQLPIQHQQPVTSPPGLAGQQPSATQQPMP